MGRCDYFTTPTASTTPTRIVSRKSCLYHHFAVRKQVPTLGGVNG